MNLVIFCLSFVFLVNASELRQKRSFDGLPPGPLAEPLAGPAVGPGPAPFGGPGPAPFGGPGPASFGGPGPAPFGGPGPVPFGGPMVSGPLPGPVAAAVIHEPAFSVVASSITVPRGNCPGGDSLGKPCDAKRPWPQCPPQSYCFAVNTVDIGPYYCCPVWSTYGAQWRPAGPYYPYYPAMPYNWPGIIQSTANWGAQTSPHSGFIGQFGHLLELLKSRAMKQRQEESVAES